mmetsp:Transcript_13901/g.33576  ORF Transcript_13901/g.33576 Transcript_13901/m.33576 type:complete len:246 (-) Transcript_13901:1379-2116(-)
MRSRRRRRRRCRRCRRCCRRRHYGRASGDTWQAGWGQGSQSWARPHHAKESNQGYQAQAPRYLHVGHRRPCSRGARLPAPDQGGPTKSKSWATNPGRRRDGRDRGGSCRWGILWRRGPPSPCPCPHRSCPRSRRQRHDWRHKGPGVSAVPGGGACVSGAAPTHGLHPRVQRRRGADLAPGHRGGLATPRAIRPVAGGRGRGGGRRGGCGRSGLGWGRARRLPASGYVRALPGSAASHPCRGEQRA